MFCIQCGTKNPPDANYCKRCGREIDREEALRISEEEFAAAAEESQPRYRKLLMEAYRLSEDGDLEAAISSCEEAIRIQPSGTDAHSLLGTLFERQGNREGAIAEREKVLALNPGSIADREKLDMLRDGVTQVHPRRITSVRSPARPQTALIDTPGGAALIAVSVTLLMLVFGGLAYYLGRDSANGRNVDPGRYAMNRIGDGTIATGPTPASASMTNSVANSGAVGVSDSAQNAVERQVTQPNAPVRAPSGNGRAMRPHFPSRTAPVQTPPTAMMEFPNGQPGRFILPENQGSVQAPSPAAGDPARGPGKIEIIVGPEGGPKPGASNPNAPAPSDPKSRYQNGQRLQIEGSYRQAIAEYVKALDGAGDEAPMIHQKIALCYYRTGDRDSAASHYGSAIKLYKDQIGAGRNQESANQGIRAAEAGIKACRS